MALTLTKIDISDQTAGNPLPGNTHQVAMYTDGVREYQGVIALDLNGNPPTASTDWALRYDEGATYTYIGKAAPGALDGDATWKIFRLTNSDNTIVWADGDSNQDNVWSDRLTLSYS